MIDEILGNPLSWVIFALVMSLVSAFMHFKKR